MPLGPYKGIPSMSGRLACVLQHLHQCPQRDGYPAVRVVQAEALDAWAEICQYPYQTTCRQMLRHELIGRIGQSLPIKGSGEDQAGVVQHQLSWHADSQQATVLHELPAL